ncbi:MAG: protein-L-isoaspartate(D-aspartate) O-methyltransferase [Chloroflexota bacterium]
MNPQPGDPYAVARARMLDQQLRSRGVQDPRVLAAMAVVPRERFVLPGEQWRAYDDRALPAGAGQTISQPLMVGLMLQLLAPDPGDRVLDIGTGTGYQAALLAAMGCAVTGIERIAELAAGARTRLAELGYGGRVEVRVGDGSRGDPSGAPWPRIVVAAAAPAIPDALTDQLADGGRLVIPVGARREQELVLVERHGDRRTQSNHGPCTFVPLVGIAGWT